MHSVFSHVPVGFRPRLRTLVFSVLVLGALLAALEILCHALGIPYSPRYAPVENPFMQFDAELGWSFLPDVHVKMPATSPQGPWTMHTDSLGVRVSGPENPADPDRPSLLFVGGSYTMGYQVNWDDSLPGHFKTMDQSGLQAVNLGVPAYGTDQSLLMLQRQIARFNAKVVVYSYMDAHIYRNGNYDRRLLYPSLRVAGTKPLFRLDPRGKPVLSKRPLPLSRYYHSRLWDLIYTRIGHILGVFPPTPKNLTRALILEMKQVTEAHGARFIVLNWGNGHNGVHQILEPGECEVVDVLANAPPGWQTLWRMPDSHPNGLAYRHAAMVLNQRLKPNA